MHKVRRHHGPICKVVAYLLIAAVASALVMPPSVVGSTLLSSLNDTISVHAQTPGSYAPRYTICTSKSLVRTANYTISTLETEYIEEHKKHTLQPFHDLLTRLNFTNISELFQNDSPTIGMAVSGGGYRSMLSGAGVFSALDEKTPGATEHLGGLLQSATYIAGNSGGLWLVANNLLNDGVPIYDAIRKQSFASPLIEGVPDVPVSQLRATLDAQSIGERNASVWESYSKMLNQTDPEKGSLVGTLLDTFFKTKESDGYLNSTPVLSRKSLDFYKDLNIEVRAKKKSGFQVSLIDYWGRAVSKKIFPQGKKSVDLCMSSVTELPSFENFSQPLPIFGSVERLPGQPETSVESHLFEFNPFEFGSWDSYLNSFVDIKFLGTELDNGVSVLKTKNEDYSVCVSGYDNMGLITGTSSGLFNTVFLYAYKMMLQMEDLSSSLLSMILRVFGITSHPKPDTFLHPEYAVYSPNPFKCVAPPNARGRLVAATQSLFLADGGDDGQNVPFHPLLVKGRQLEVIFAFDATSDRENFPNGTTLMKTGKRYHSYDSSLRLPVFASNGRVRRVFPKVPTREEFVRDKLGSHPIFLGCSVSRDFPLVDMSMAVNQVADNEFIEHQKSSEPDKFVSSFLLKFDLNFDIWEDYTPPLIVYFANYNHTYSSNTSTFRTVYNDADVNAMLENGYNVATYNNDTEYIRCVGCALIKRKADSSEKASKYLENCGSCFDKFCYVAPD